LESLAQEEVRYNVTKEPAYGHIYRHNTPVSQFTHADVDSDCIQYIQNDIRSSADYFEVVIYDIQNVLSSARIEVIVKARVTKVEDALRIVIGRTGVVTADHLDAGELAVETNSNPVYYVLSPPRYFFGVNECLYICVEEFFVYLCSGVVCSYVLVL